MSVARTCARKRKNMKNDKRYAKVTHREAERRLAERAQRQTGKKK